MVKKINIISVDNGVGLSLDRRIIETTLGSEDYEFNFIDIYKGGEKKQADLNFFLEIVEKKYFHLARKNVLIPNPEWFFQSWTGELKRFDYIFAKTQDCKRIFSRYNDNVIFTSFTTPDYFQPEVKRSRTFLHVAGQSDTKGTKEILRAFEDKKHQLVIVKYNERIKTIHGNIHIIAERIKSDLLRTFQNTCMFHICTSQYEGFGHCINEARSCGICITTNAPPMNEMIRDKRLLVSVRARRRMNMATLAVIDWVDLARKVNELARLPDEELRQIQEQCRRLYLENDTMFKHKFKEVVNAII